MRAFLQAAASASRPASVSLLATTLVTLCACTPEGGTCGLDGANTGGHVFDEAFTCLQGVAATTPTGSAQTECVKAGLVALKECAEVRHICKSLRVCESCVQKCSDAFGTTSVCAFPHSSSSSFIIVLVRVTNESLSRGRCF